MTFAHSSILLPRSAILHVAEHLCGQQPSPPAFAAVDDIWAAVYNVVARVAPSSARMCDAPSMSLKDRQAALLSALLCYAVSDGCSDRQTHVGMILSLPRDVQQRLMGLIEQNRSIRTKTPVLPRMDNSSDIASIGSRRSFGDVITSPSGYTPIRKRRSPNSQMSVGDIFSPGTIDPSVERMIDELKSKNKSLMIDLEKSTTREADLAIKLQELEMKVRRNMMKIETESMRSMADADEAHEKELSALREELFQLQDIRDKEQKAQRELIKIRDELDLMVHSQEKLAETEEKLRKCRERLEQLTDIKDCLKREEEAHSVSVEERLRLENELKALQPLRRQLEEYKVRAVEAEFQLIDCREELKRLSEMSHNLSSAHEDMIGGARSFQEEAEVLRKKLSQDQDTEYDGPTVGEGISEMNPHVKEELLRLRNENEQLKAFAAKRSEDNVQRLEEKLEDVQRLSDRFKDQYLSTKKQWETTLIELEETQEREEDLKEEVAEWMAKLDDMTIHAKDLQLELTKIKGELEETIALLGKSKQSEEKLCQDIADLSHAKELIQAESDQRLEEGNKIRQELDERLEMLLESQAREKTLHCELEEMEVKMQNTQQRSAEFENELNVTFDELERTKSELNSTIDRENGLRGEVTTLTEIKGDLERQLEIEKQGREGDRMSAECLLNETRDMLQAKAKCDIEELQTNMNLLLEDERTSFRKKLEKAASEYHELKEKNINEYEDLKRKMTNGLEAAKADYEARIQHLNHEYTFEIERLKSQAEEDREKLLAKGKGMLKESKGKADEIIRELEDELDDIKLTLSNLRKEKDEYEHKTRAKFSSYKHKLQFSMSRINELSGETEHLNEVISVLEREKTKVLEENERYRRQLGGRYGADGKSQNQMEMLQKEFNAVLDENRALKKKIATSGSLNTLGVISEESDLDFGDSGAKPYARGGVSGSTLAALREEYEEQLQAMNDEKRELMMKNSAAVTDVQKAEQRSWELEKEVDRLKQEVTSAQLALQRAELHMDDNKMETSTINEKSFFSAKDDHEYADNLTSGPSDEVGQENAEQLLDLSVRVPSAPATPKFVLSPSHRQNWNGSTKKAAMVGGGKITSTGADILNLSVSSEGPTLLELTQQDSNAHDAQPECKQS